MTDIKAAALPPLPDEKIDELARPFAGMGGVEDYRAFARAVVAADRAQLAQQGQEPVAIVVIKAGQLHIDMLTASLKVGDQLYAKAAPASAQPADLKEALIELTSTQRKLIDANAEIAALLLARGEQPADELVQLRAQNMLLVHLYDAVAKLVKAKGRFHTEQNYGALVAAYDLVRTADTVTEPAPATPTYREATTELSLPELAEQFAAVAALGGKYTLSAGVCAMLHRAMTTGETECTEAAQQAQAGKGAKNV